MTCLGCTILVALNTKEAHFKQIRDKYNNIPQNKIEDITMIIHFDRISNWDAKYIPNVNFRLIRLISLVSDLTGRLRKVNICDVQNILQSEFIVSCIPDKQIFTRKGKYINDPCILKEVTVIDMFLQDNFTDIRFRH